MTKVKCTRCGFKWIEPNSLKEFSYGCCVWCYLNEKEWTKEKLEKRMIDVENISQW